MNNEDYMELTALAIREQLMRYFKDNNIFLVAKSNVRLDYQNPSGNRNYDRWEAGVQQRSLVILGNQPIIAVMKEPAKITYLRYFSEGDFLPQIKTKIERFMTDFLPAVEQGDEV
jgi:hypothetical protein